MSDLRQMREVMEDHMHHEELQKEFNDIKPITFAYSTKPIGKVVNKKTYPTGIEFTIELDVSDKSEEEIEDLKARITKVYLRYSSENVF